MQLLPKAEIKKLVKKVNRLGTTLHLLGGASQKNDKTMRMMIIVAEGSNNNSLMLRIGSVTEKDVFLTFSQKILGSLEKSK